MDINQTALDLHKKFKGKINTGLRDIPTKETLAAYYTPGVAAVSSRVAEHPEELRDYTWTNNVVAIVSDGSAVLGLGDIGPEGAMPVMEGKAMLFKHFAGVDAVPIVLDVHTPDEIVAAVTAIAPSFGGINLEDIAAPKCFEIEARLKATLKIPVMHDDQHATAVVVLAGLINAMKVTKRQFKDCRIVLIGAGAAGVAVAKLLHDYAQPEIIAVDTKGAILQGRTDLTPQKQALASYNSLSFDAANPQQLGDVLAGADVVVGISKPNMLTAKDIASMAKDPIVFALSNPTPEIMPDVARKAGAAVVATGRSDFPNQVNNALVFPGLFRGALDHRVTQITDAHKLKAAAAIASIVKEPTAERIIPSLFETTVVTTVAAQITSADVG